MKFCNQNVVVVRHETVAVIETTADEGVDSRLQRFSCQQTAFDVVVTAERGKSGRLPAFVFHVMSDRSSSDQLIMALTVYIYI